MERFKAWWLLLLGAGLVAVALQGAVRGWLPSGRAGFQRGKGVSRDSQPLGFWLAFALYAGFGGYVALYALRLLAGRP